MLYRTQIAVTNLYRIILIWKAMKRSKRHIAKSKIKYDSKGDLIDVRYQKDIKAYAEWQAGNRQLNAENKEFAQMQAYYKSKG